MTITYLLIGVTCLISYLAFNNRELFNQLCHYPYIEAQDKSYYRMLSSGFVHADFTHLLINMYVLYIFGNTVEYIFTSYFGDLLGRILFLFTYLAAIIIGDLPSYFKHKDNRMYRAIGASGATSAIVLMYCIFFPWSWLYLFFVIPIPGIIFAVLYLVYSSWASKNSNDNIGHDAHFWGAIAGVVIIFALIPSQIPTFIQEVLSGPNSWPRGMF